MLKHSLISLLNNNYTFLDDVVTVNNSGFLTFVKQLYISALPLTGQALNVIHLWWVSLVKQELLILPYHLSSPSVFSWVRVPRSYVLCICFEDRCLSFFFWPLCCLSLIDTRILITTLVSSYSSCGFIHMHYSM